MITENLTQALRRLAQDRPIQTALVYLQPGQADEAMDYLRLDQDCDRFANGLRRAGLTPGQRVLVLARPDRHFAPFVLGLLRAGGSVVMVDPGRPLAEFLDCVAQAAPSALLAPPLLHALSPLFPRALGRVRLRFCAGGTYPGAWRLSSLAQASPEPFESPTTGESEAAVIFTTGATGAPKGVVYTHELLRQQAAALLGALNLPSGGVGLFGPSAMMLLGLISGVKTVVDASLSASPRQVDINRLAQRLVEQQVTVSFASPALCRRLARRAAQSGLRFPHLRQLVAGGAPVDRGLIEALQPALPNGEVVVSLGATEVMPVAAIGGGAALAKYQAPANEWRGVCCGYPAPGHTLAVIPISEQPLEAWTDDLRLPPQQVGEIVVRGPAVCGPYLNLPRQSALALIPGGNAFWRRTGDLGSLDQDGCLWFVGRKSQRVVTGSETLYTLPCEAMFNRHPAVERSALVGLGSFGSQTPVIVIESRAGMRPASRAAKTALAREMLALAAAHPHTRPIRHLAFFPGEFPVDIRHNAKIRRELLARWAERSRSSLLL